MEEKTNIENAELKSLQEKLAVKEAMIAEFKAKEKHFGIDIVGPENEAIKATLDGTVILASWSSETGYTITVQHSNNLISVYKHNSALLKK